MDRQYESWPTLPVEPRTKTAGHRRRVHFVLFFLTFLTTTLAGAMNAGQDPFESLSGFLAGVPFSVTLMAILFAHEMGHYLMAMGHGVGATLPYFIPGPPWLVGTFGAFIRMRGMPKDRRALFDVGAAGPWAGVMIAIPAVMLGLRWSTVKPLEDGLAGGLTLGDSLMFSWLTELILGVSSSEVTILLHPVALAGWFGIFVTFLNLLPIGQLDGGHVTYALFGQQHARIARIFLAVILGLGFLGWQGWFMWAFLLTFVLKLDHPDTIDPETALDPVRRTAAWATVALFFLTFIPVPLRIAEPHILELVPPDGKSSPLPPDSRRPPRFPKQPRERWPDQQLDTPPDLVPASVSLPQNSARQK